MLAAEIIDTVIGRDAKYPQEEGTIRPEGWKIPEGLKKYLMVDPS
jgi:hypothetical protein